MTKQKFLQTTDKQWDTILALHGTAPFKLVRAAAPYFRVKDGEPRNIVNISSTSGLHGNAGQANYALAKAGVTGLTKTIAKEWGPAFGVRANTVAFGHIATRLTAAKEEGAFATTPDGQKIALGIPAAQKAARERCLSADYRSACDGFHRSTIGSVLVMRTCLRVADPGGGSAWMGN